MKKQKQKYFRRAHAGKGGKHGFYFVEKKTVKGKDKEIKTTPLKWTREKTKLVQEKFIREAFYEEIKKQNDFPYYQREETEPQEEEQIEFEPEYEEEDETPPDEAPEGEGGVFWEKETNVFQDIYDNWYGSIIYAEQEFANAKEFWRFYLTTRGNEDKNLQGSFVSDLFHTLTDSISEVMKIDFIEQISATP